MRDIIQRIIKLRSISILKELLKRKRVPEVQQSIRVIVEETVKHTLDHGQRYSRTAQILMKCFKSLKMRCYHYPLQYALGTWYFRGLIIKIQPPLLIPRFQTQYFVELVVSEIQNRWKKGSNLTIVDYCCGTGVIGLSILKQLEKQYKIRCVFIDIKQKATKFTQINRINNSINKQQVQIVQGDMNNYLHLIQSADVVIANPPYIGQRQYRRLEHQVKLFQDKQALLSGYDGMDLSIPLIEALLQKKAKKILFLGAIEYGGQCVSKWNLQDNVKKDQYGRRRYLII